jgi:cysteine desulfurase
MLFKRKKTFVYLDHASATPLEGEVRSVMEPFFKEKFGNPSALHTKGKEAKETIRDARKSVARVLGARANEIIFTAGGTESINLALMGVAHKKQSKRKPHYYLYH